MKNVPASKGLRKGNKIKVGVATYIVAEARKYPNGQIEFRYEGQELWRYAHSFDMVTVVK